MDFVKDFTVTKEAGSQVKIAGEIPFLHLEKHRAAALKSLGKNLKINGFRAGHVPEKVLMESIGEMKLISEMAERALASVYPKAIAEHKVEAIGHPQIAITKIAKDNPLGFTATVAVVPEIKLPDYKKLATEVNRNKETAEVSEVEVEKQIEDILRQKAAYERLQAKAAKTGSPDSSNEESQTHTHADGTVHEGPAHDHDEAKTIELNAKSVAPKDGSPSTSVKEVLTDEVVKTLGAPGQFETVADFKKKLREHLEITKKQETGAKHRAKLTDKIIEDSQFELPQILIDSELNQMFAQMESDLKRANMKLDDYFTHIKKTKDDLKKEWTPAAEKRARLQLVLNEIAKVEKIEPDKEALEKEVKHLLEHYKDADEMRVRIYVASVLQNEAVMKLLEDQK